MTILTNYRQLVFNHSLGFAYDRPVRGVVFHTTEGTTVAGAVSVYRSIQACPHLTVDPDRHDKLQHVPLDSAAYALRNLRDGCETNSAGVIQIEIVGYASEAWSWSPERLRWIGEEVLAPILAAFPAIPHDVYQGPRMTCDQWDTWPGGLCGHAHVPENDHWDPGDLDLQAVLNYALGDSSPLENDDMPSAKEVAAAIMDELVPVHDYATGNDVEVPRRIAEGWQLGELSLIRHHLTGVPPK